MDKKITELNKQIGKRLGVSPTHDPIVHEQALLAIFEWIDYLASEIKQIKQDKMDG
jgi:hypothetical protein